MPKINHVKNETPFLNLMYVRVVCIIAVTMIIYITTQHSKETHNYQTLLTSIQLNTYNIHETNNKTQNKHEFKECQLHYFSQNYFMCIHFDDFFYLILKSYI